MMPRGFKPVGWVAAVGGAALGCYMLSLNVAAERAELAKVERQIVQAKQDIRALQTELGTRGRLQQLEHWNAEVLALSAPAAPQFIENEMMLARFETHEPTIEEKAKVQMAAATSAPAPVMKAAPTVVGKKLAPSEFAEAATKRGSAPSHTMVQQASYDPDQAKGAPVAKAASAASAKPKPVKADVKPAVAAKVAAVGEIATEVGGQ